MNTDLLADLENNTYSKLGKGPPKKMKDTEQSDPFPSIQVCYLLVTQKATPTIWSGTHHGSVYC